MGSIGGYRLVRRLGAGAHAEVWLGRREFAHAATGTQDDDGLSPVMESQHLAPLVAVKVYRPETPAEAIDAEIAMLSATWSGHLLPIIDIAMERDRRPCLILPRLDPAGLARVVSSTGTVTAGEFVTLVVPVARALEATHSNGFAYGALRPSKVLLDESGAPILLGTTGALRLPIASPAARRESGPLLADRRALAEFARSFADRVAAGPHRLEELRLWLEGERWQDAAFASELIDRAFDAAPAEPLTLEWVGTGRADEDTLDQRGSTAVRIGGVGTGERHRPDRGAAADVGNDRGSPRSRSQVSTTMMRLVAVVRAAIAGARVRLSTAIATVRPKYRVLGAISAVMIAGVAALALAPSGQASTTDASPRTIPNPVAAVPTADPPAVASSPADAEGTDQPMIDGDPISAVGAVLTEREECLRAASIECLAGPVQPDSAAWQADRVAIAELRGGSRSYAPFWTQDSTATIVDVMGAVMLVRVDDGDSLALEHAETATTSVLMIRTEAGWKLRDVFAE